MRFPAEKYAPLIAHVGSYIVLTNLLVYSYQEYQVPIWGYLGYSSDYSTTRHLVANVGAGLLALMVPARMAGLTSYTLALVASSTIVAMLAMYAARGYSFLYLLSVFVFFYLVKILAERVRLRIPPRKSSLIPIVALSGGALGISVAWIAARGGLANLSLDISRIYLVREIAMDRYFVGPFVYLINWAQKIFGTTLFALGIIRGSAFLIGFVVVAQFFFYAALGQKTPVAMLAFVILAIIVAKRRPSTWLLNFLLVALISISIALSKYGFIEPLALFVMRVFFGPAGNNIVFFEFFSDNPFTYFSTSILRHFIDYPYDLGVLDLISIERLGETGINPNTGVFGTGYMHMGYVGLILYAVLCGLILALFESLAKGMPSWVPLAVAGAPMYIMFTSTDLPIALMTNGGIIAMVVLFLWPSEQKRAAFGLDVRPMTSHGER